MLFSESSYPECVFGVRLYKYMIMNTDLINGKYLLSIAMVSSMVDVFCPTCWTEVKLLCLK